MSRRPLCFFLWLRADGQRPFIALHPLRHGAVVHRDVFLPGQFAGERKFVWVKRKISPEQKQAVHDLGEPGLLFGPREMRLYPNGRLAAHVLGGAGFGGENTTMAAQVYAQFVGVAVTVVYSFVVSFVLLKVVDIIVGLRVAEDAEEEGLDLALHDERGYIL